MDAHADTAGAAVAVLLVVLDVANLEDETVVIVFVLEIFVLLLVQTVLVALTGVFVAVAYVD